VLLYTAPLSDTGKARLRAMAETTDGFEIARRDLEIRGPGEFMGSRQSGDALLRFADLQADTGLLAHAREVARELWSRHPQAARAHVYDPNLRLPHDDAATALAGLPGAWLVKLNEEEATRFCGWLGLPEDDTALERWLREERGVARLCITRGGNGASLWVNGAHHHGAAVPVTVVDTVGAGDSFLAMLTVSLLTGLPPQAAVDRALRVGALVASRPGAIPAYTLAELQA
jgi:sugar/nucleoside kinase (ribokinase family)